MEIPMMINKRLIGIVPESRKYIAGNVALQWLSLVANMVMMTAIATLLSALYFYREMSTLFSGAVVAMLAALLVRFGCAIGASKMSYLSSKEVKKTLRRRIYEKLLRLGASYQEQTTTSEVVQVAVEGVDQLETYFGAYLPQFFYAMLAPLTLFIYLCFINVPSAVVLLICVPLIPVAIAAVQTWAKRLLAKYWGQYTALGDTFLENLQGLTTLKIYQSDAYKNEEMNAESEKFRKITMKVLIMQLNSITIMDFIAYGGAALGIILSVSQMRAGKVDLAGCLLIILLAADFFIPMRQLGSFFHIAMNGMAASEKIFRLLDLPEREDGGETAANEDNFEASAATTGEATMTKNGKMVQNVPFPTEGDICLEQVHFAYEADREILHGVDLVLRRGRLTAIVGESGCGKSTISGILMGRNGGYTGTVRVGTVDMRQIPEVSRMQNITYVSHQSYLFRGTVRENLCMGRPEAAEEELWQVLEKVRLADFLRSEQGLETPVQEKGSNFSGGQCQRLALARALLHDSPVYINQQATSNIDVESENDIMALIRELAATGEKTILLISHRLANVVEADRIYVMDAGIVTEQGTQEELLAKNGTYARLWNAQQSLENYGKRGAQA